MIDLNLIPQAYAATNTGTVAQGGGVLSTILLLVGFMIIFYFLLIRPQSKRAKEHRDLIASLQVSDEVITNGGIVGKISKIKDDFIILVIAENVEIKIQKAAISNTLPKGTMKSIS